MVGGVPAVQSPRSDRVSARTYIAGQYGPYLVDLSFGTSYLIDSDCLETDSAEGAVRLYRRRRHRLPIGEDAKVRAERLVLEWRQLA